MIFELDIWQAGSSLYYLGQDRRSHEENELNN